VNRDEPAGDPTHGPTGRPAGLGVLADVLAEAVGRGRRHDPVLPRTGGPAGNARVSAWAGLVLLVLSVAELVTVLDVTGLLDWHVGLGIALVGFTLLKIASTGWRMLRYYAGSASYRSAGPPPLLLRLLGPLVVLSTLGVLGSGLALLAIGPRAGDQQLFAVLGQQVSALTVHQAFFLLFAVFVGLHLCARLVPALSRAVGRPREPAPEPNAVAADRVPGRPSRTVAVLGTALAGLVAALLVVPTVPAWHRDRFDHGRPGHTRVRR
jgi:hypothetical protein